MMPALSCQDRRRPGAGAFRPLSLGLLGASLFALAACSSPPTRFFVLTSLQSGAALDGESGLVLGLEPVQLPALLDRPHIVTRVGENERRLAEFARWAEPLEDNVAGVLAENLSALLESERVVLLPTLRAVPLDRRLRVDVLRFDATPGVEAVLEVRWKLFDAGTGELLLIRHETYGASMAGDDPAAVVAAMSEALDALSRGLAAALTR